MSDNSQIKVAETVSTVVTPVVPSTSQQPRSNAPGKQKGKTRNRQKFYDKSKNLDNQISDRKDPKMATKSIPPSLSVARDRPTFPVHTSNRGAAHIARAVFRQQTAVLRGFNVTEADLVYMAQLAWIYRVVEVNIEAGTQFYSDTSLLKQVGKSLLLPAPICEYIESIGTVEMLAGHTVGPYFVSYRDLLRRNVERRQANLEPLFDECDELLAEGREWPVNTDRVLAFTANIMRATLKGLTLRHLDMSTLTGKMSFLVTRQESFDPGSVVGRTPQVLEDGVAQLGACYDFRRFEERLTWVGDHNYLLMPSHTSNVCEPNLLLASKIAESMVARFSKE